MNYLKKMPFWGWFIIVTIVCYAVWNPSGYSAYDLWASSPVTENIFLKLFITLILSTILLFMFFTTLQTIGKIGIAIYIAFLVIVFGLFYEMGVFEFSDLSTARFWAQPLTALLLTIGISFEKIRFAVTGIRATDEEEG